LRKRILLARVVTLGLRLLRIWRIPRLRISLFVGRTRESVPVLSQIPVASAVVVGDAVWVGHSLHGTLPADAGLWFTLFRRLRARRAAGHADAAVVSERLLNGAAWDCAGGGEPSGRWRRPPRARQKNRQRPKSGREVSSMPFGMGPAGWFLMPYFASYWAQWYSPAVLSYVCPQLWGAPAAQQELQFLRAQAEMLEGQLEWIRSRISQLEKAE